MISRSVYVSEEMNMLLKETSERTKESVNSLMRRGTEKLLKELNPGTARGPAARCTTRTVPCCKKANTYGFRDNLLCPCLCHQQPPG